MASCASRRPKRGTTRRRRNGTTRKATCPLPKRCVDAAACAASSPASQIWLAQWPAASATFFGVTGAPMCAECATVVDNVVAPCGECCEYEVDKAGKMTCKEKANCGLSPNAKKLRLEKQALLDNAGVRCFRSHQGRLAGTAVALFATASRCALRTARNWPWVRCQRAVTCTPHPPTANSPLGFPGTLPPPTHPSPLRAQAGDGV